jgi:hypothetical protein
LSFSWDLPEGECREIETIPASNSKVALCSASVG